MTEVGVNGSPVIIAISKVSYEITLTKRGKWGVKITFMLFLSYVKLHREISFHNTILYDGKNVLLVFLH